MIRAKTSLVAEGVTTDRETRQISAFGLIQNLQTANYPLYVQKIAFFSLWERASTDPSRCRAEFSITLDGQDLTRQAVDIDFGQHLQNRCIVRLDGFELKAPGHVVMRLAVPGHEAAEWTMEAGLITDATPVVPGVSRHIYKLDTASMSLGKVDTR